MKGLVDKSIGIVTRIAEALARIKPTESLRLDKREHQWCVERVPVHCLLTLFEKVRDDLLRV